ncbi:transcription factor bHLH106-like [Diospyros lotus]|uniref:transcription factor bHLH106-like n=1 Tax=Diospyros lotus TaxID=55363 RepID=UPI00225206E2|nr:transcription factor bHLH106-like [Diospyros lotus]
MSNKLAASFTHSKAYKLKQIIQRGGILDNCIKHISIRLQSYHQEEQNQTQVEELVMYSIPSYYELGSCSNSANFLQGVLSSSAAAAANSYLGNSTGSSRSSTAEEKAAAASKSHSEAERRRRKRINGHLATLRTLVPNTIKTDKASLLAEVVRRLRELKKTTTELATNAGEGGESRQYPGEAGTQLINVFPSEADELKLCYCEGGSLIKATLCCEDRPELMAEVGRAVRAAEGRVVRAEMATVGGRLKSVLWVQVAAGCAAGGDESLGGLRRALKVVVDKAGLSAGLSHVLPENKRPRLSHHQF